MTAPTTNRDTALVTLAVTPRQLCVLAALVHHEESLIRAKGKESGRSLLAEHVDTLEQEQDREALARSTQNTLERLETAITLEYYRVTFVAVNYTRASLERFQEALKETFPDCQRYVCTLQQSDRKTDPDVLGFHVYVPTDAGRPSVPLLLAMVADLKGIQYDGLSQCWLGEKDAASDESWTLLP